MKMKNIRLCLTSLAMTLFMFAIMPAEQGEASIIHKSGTIENNVFVKANDISNAKKIGLNTTKITLSQGEKQQLTIQGYSGKVSWKVNRKSIAVVDKNGIVTGVAPGTTTVIATANGKEYKCSVKVNQKEVQLVQKEIKIYVGEQLQINAEGYYKKITWKANRKTIATVDKQGLVTGIKPGTTTVIAKIDGKEYKCTVKVIKNAIALNKNKVIVCPGESVQLKLSGYYKEIRWESDSSEVEVSEDGLINIAKNASAQNAIVKAVADGKEYSCTVIVEEVKTFNASVRVYDMIRIPIVGTSREYRVYSTNPSIGEILGIDDIDGVKYIRVVGHKVGETKVNVEVGGHVFSNKVRFANNVDYASGTGYLEGLSEENAELAAKQYQKISKITSEIISADMTDFEKVRAIHDWIIANTLYDRENAENNTMPQSSHSIEGVLDYGVAVCDGYAKTFRAMCENVGLQCYLIYGIGASGSSHAWNTVKVDDKWYQIDTTWDDYDGTQKRILDYYYEYYLVSDEKMKLTHTWNDVFPKAYEDYYDEELLKEIERQYQISGKLYTSQNDVINCLMEEMNAGRNKITIATTKEIAENIDAIELAKMMRGTTDVKVYVSYIRHMAYTEITVDLRK